MSSNFDKMDRDIPFASSDRAMRMTASTKFFFNFCCVSLAIDELSGNYSQTSTFKMEQCYKRTTLYPPINKIKNYSKLISDNSFSYAFT